jgi:hypothetical protein
MDEVRGLLKDGEKVKPADCLDAAKPRQAGGA